MIENESTTEKEERQLRARRTLDTGVSPDGWDLSLLILTPDGIQSRSDVVRDDPSNGILHRRVSSSADDDVRLELDSIGEEDSIFGEVLDFLTLLELDLALGDERAASDVDVVSSAVSEVPATSRSQN